MRLIIGAALITSFLHQHIRTLSQAGAHARHTHSHAHAHRHSTFSLSHNWHILCAQVCRCRILQSHIPETGLNEQQVRAYAAFKCVPMSFSPEISVQWDGVRVKKKRMRENRLVLLVTPEHVPRSIARRLGSSSNNNSGRFLPFAQVSRLLLIK